MEHETLWQQENCVCASSKGCIFKNATVIHIVQFYDLFSRARFRFVQENSSICDSPRLTFSCFAACRSRAHLCSISCRDRSPLRGRRMALNIFWLNPVGLLLCTHRRIYRRAGAARPKMCLDRRTDRGESRSAQLSVCHRGSARLSYATKCSVRMVLGCIITANNHLWTAVVKTQILLIAGSCCLTVHST